MSSWVLLSAEAVVDDCWSMRELMMLSEWIMDIVNGPLAVCWLVVVVVVVDVLVEI